MVFGGVDPVSKIVESDNAFDLAFSKEQNCKVWKKIGATPLSPAYLQNHKTYHCNFERGEK